MANLLDYLEERGGVPFDEEPLNEADNLALCQLAYCGLDRAVPWLDARRSVTLAQAWRAYASRRGKALGKIERLFRAMARSKRFGRVRLVGFYEHFDRAAHEQFAAYTAILPDGTAYVAFRGTNNHISGWRENFMMSYMEVGAQVDAKRYLDAVGRLTSGPIHVGGHSKGGNLAAYAAAFCEPSTRERIEAVWCNDPPGFMREVVDFGAFDAIIDRMRLFVPEFCVVAGIMEQVAQPTVIRSSQRRYMQHDAMSWQVEAGHLVRGDVLLPECLRVGRVFYQLIYTRSRAERVDIVNDLFDAISLAGIETVGDFADGGARTVERVMAQLRTCDDQTRTAVREVLVSLAGVEVSSAVAGAFAGVDKAIGNVLGVEGATGGAGSCEPHGMSLLDAHQRPQASRRAPVALARSVMGSPLLAGALLMVAGVLVMANADAATPVLGYVAVLAVAAYAIASLARYLVDKVRDGNSDAVDLAVGVLALLPAVALLVFDVSVTVMYNFVVGAGLIAYALAVARRMYRRWRSGQQLGFAVVAVAVALPVGIMLLLDPTRLVPALLLVAGGLITVLGISRFITSGHAQKAMPR